MLHIFVEIIEQLLIDYTVLHDLKIYNLKVLRFFNTERCINTIEQPITQ